MVILALLGVVIHWCIHADDGQVSKVPEPPAADATSDTEDTLPAPYPSTDFALILDWTETGEFLELGEQQGEYPFGTSLWLDGKETAVTADDGSTVHAIDRLQSGGIRLRYSHIEEEDQPPRNIITLLETTLTKEVSTPRGIHVGSSKADGLQTPFRMVCRDFILPEFCKPCLFLSSIQFAQLIVPYLLFCASAAMSKEKSR